MLGRPVVRPIQITILQENVSDKIATSRGLVSFTTLSTLQAAELVFFCLCFLR